jgi:hypothetical protein
MTNHDPNQPQNAGPFQPAVPPVDPSTAPAAATAVEASPAPAVAPKRSFSRRVLAIVSAAALVVGLLIGGGAGIALGTTVFSGNTEQGGFDRNGTRPDFGNGGPPDMGTAPDSATPPATDDDTSTDDSGSTSSDSSS